MTIAEARKATEARHWFRLKRKSIASLLDEFDSRLAIAHQARDAAILEKRLYEEALKTVQGLDQYDISHEPVYTGVASNMAPWVMTNHMIKDNIKMICEFSWRGGLK